MEVHAVAACQHQPLPEDADTPCSSQDYVFVRTLRLVRPYYFDFKCFVKKRWEGLTLVQLFSQEFPMLSEAYYKQAFLTGRLRVEGMPQLQLSTPLRTGMCIRHLIHRHEPPVLAGEVQVLGQTEEFVAVNKPACMPVHTVGQYRKNTVLGVLQAQSPELGPLYPTYRLDKPVSGLLLLARSSAVAGRMRKLLEERLCSKSYITRVLGCFPATTTATATATATEAEPGSTSEGPEAVAGGGPVPGSWELAAEGSELPGGAAALQLPGVSVLEEGWLQVDVPLSWDPRTNHVSAAPPGSGLADAKDAVTLFRLVSVAPDKSTSVVECRPKTGRTHQIRVHLQYLGHAIANDSQYGGIYGPPLAFRLNQPVPVLGPGSRPGPGPAVGTCREPGEDVVRGAAKRPRHEPHTALDQDQDQAQAKAQAQVEGGLRSPAAAELPSTAAAPDVPAEAAHCSKSAAEQQQRQQGPAEQQLDRGGAGAGSAHCHSEHSALLPGAGGRDDFNKQFSASEEVLPETIRELYLQDCYRVEPALQESVCPHCPCLVPKGYPIDLEPLWLHALAYSGPGWAFEAPPPTWADQGFIPTRQPNQTLGPKQVP